MKKMIAEPSANHINNTHQPMVPGGLADLCPLCWWTLFCQRWPGFCQTSLDRSVEPVDKWIGIGTTGIDTNIRRGDTR